MADPDTTDVDLVERTALGTPAARRLRGRASRDVVQQILHRATALANARFAVGVEILPYELVAVLADPHGVPLAWRRWAVPEMEVDTVVKRLAAATKELVSTSLGYELPDSHIGLGLQIGGPVNPAKTVVLSYCNHPTDHAFREHAYHWARDVPLADLVREETGCQTIVENDAAAYAVYEQRFGVGRHAPSFAVILVRDGVGGGVVLDDQLAPIPFEVGHIQFQPRGRRCDCGNLGCVEAYAGRRAIRAIVGDAIGAYTDIEDFEMITELSRPGNDQAAQVLQVVRQGGLAIAHGVATVLTMFGVPEIVIFAPPALTDRAHPTATAFLEGVEAFRQTAFPVFRDCRLHVRPLSRTDGAHGAALAALNEFFYVPLTDPGYQG
jgi:glucokinase